jgi:DNA-binding CsgD family transcriptional regulator
MTTVAPAFELRGKVSQALLYARELRQLYHEDRQLRDDLKRARFSLKDSHQKVVDLTALLQHHLERKQELDQAYSELVDGVRKVLVGSSSAAAPLAEAKPHRGYGLSPREVEVLQMVAEGYSNKEIAGHFGLTEHTVKNHLTGIMRKLGARDRAHAVVLALREGRILLG